MKQDEQLKCLIENIEMQIVELNTFDQKVLLRPDSANRDYLLHSIYVHKVKLKDLLQVSVSQGQGK